MLKNNRYIEENYSVAEIDARNEIRVVTTEDIINNSILVDIRKYSLYGNSYDDIKRATDKGIKFKFENIPTIIDGLVSIMVKRGMLLETDANSIKAIMSNNVIM